MSGDLRRYRKKAHQPVTAVRLDIDLVSFVYRKWGGEQRAQKGDWLVDNGGNVYTVASDSFAKTYSQVSPGVFVKTAPVYARQATESGRVKTKEGESEYRAGDYIVCNEPDGEDAYSISAESFAQMYELDESWRSG